MNWLLVFEIVSGTLSIITLLSILIKPIREKIFSTQKSREGERCLLRSEMLRIYYANLDKGEIRQYEFENFIKCYDAYKALGGNSFIDDINLTVREWRIIR